MLSAKEKKMRKKSKKTGDSGKNSEDPFLSYLRDINRIPLLSKEEELTTAKLAAEGNKAAKEKLITSNLRFVIMVAKKYQNQGLPFLDLISEGNMGLLNAAKHFDPEKGYRFITYAVWWVRQAIVKAIHEKSRMIRLPSNKSRELINREKGNLSENKKPLYNVLSLEDPLYKQGEPLTLKDSLQSDSDDSPMEQAANSILKEEIEAMLSDLEKRSADVLRCRFGLGGTAPMTLKEVGDRYHLSRERVRQIENRAIRQLESSSREHKLDSYNAI